jgi:5-methylcytosine-specific restriction protein A
MPWASSDRRSRLPKDWAKRRARVKARAQDRCEADTHEPTCNGWGSECDHRVAGDDHSLANLQWLSAPCHRAKTQREAQWHVEGRQRAAEQHPGKIN